jgi:hypothetical protein
MIMLFLDCGFQWGPFGKEVWLYPFYIDEEPVGVADFARLATNNGHQCLIDGEGDGFAAIVEPKWAAKYAEWADKQLPNMHEWYAATWQLGAGNSPEQWHDWSTAREGLRLRLAAAIRAKIAPHANCLATQEPPMSDAEKRARIEYHWSASWINDSPTLARRFHEQVINRFERLDVTCSDEQKLAWAHGLATSTSLPVEEKCRIILSLPRLSEEQVTGLIGIFEEEKEKFLALEASNYDELLITAGKSQIAFLKVLFAPMDNIEAEMDDDGRLTDEGAGVFKESLENPTAPWIRSLSSDEFDGMWSGMTGVTSGFAALRGNPFEDKEWAKFPLTPAERCSWNVGIRCVIPLFTRQDFDLVEPLDCRGSAKPFRSLGGPCAVHRTQ